MSDQVLFPYLQHCSGCFLQENACVGDSLILSIAKFLRAPILKSICEWLFLKMCLWNWEELKFIYKEFFNLIFKRRSKVQEKNMSCERALNFDHWKTFSENYEPMRGWSWLVYKFTKNHCCSQLFSEFIQTQNTYPNLKTTSKNQAKIFLVN